MINDAETERLKAFNTIKLHLTEVLGIMNKAKLNKLADICLIYYEKGFHNGSGTTERKKLIIEK